MKQGWKKRWMAALALMLALAVVPLALALAESTATYGKATADQVYVRKQPKTDADYWFRVDTGHVAKILDEVTQSGKSWYKVETGSPENNGHSYTGYIMKDFFTPLTAEETEAWLANGTLGGSSSSGTSSGSQASGTTVVVTGRQGEISAGGTNFRMSPSTSGEKIMSLERGTIVEITSIPETVDTDHWYGVRYQGYNGYVMSTFIRLLPEDTSSSVGNVLVHGYVKLIRSSANLRSAPDGPIAITDGWKSTGSLLPYVSDPVTKSGYTWYEVVYEGARYWVRSDCVQTVDSTGSNITPPSATEAPGSAAATTKGYVVTTLGGVNLRLQPFGESFAQIKKGVTLPYEHVVEPYSANNNSKYTWYYVVYNSMHGYVRSDCVSITTGSTATATPGVAATPGTTAAPTSTVAPGNTPAYSYVKMIKTDVALRTTPGGKVQERLKLNTVVPVIGTTMKASNYVWYPVRAADGTTGYVRGDCVMPCNADGSVGTSPSATNNPGATSAPTATPEPTPANGVYGYVQITMDKTFIRKTMNGDKLFRVEQKGGIYPMWGQQGNKNNYVWYPIVINGVNGWVRGDCAKIVNQSGATAEPTATPTPTPTGSEQASTYVITILDNVNLRASASTDANSVTKVPQGTVMAYSTKTSSGGYQWYHVVYNSKDVWVRGDCVRVMSQAEYDAWLQQQTPTSTPDTSTSIGYVKTIAKNVNIRKTANGSYAGRQIAQSGTVLPYTQTRTVNNVVWYYIETSDGFRGWINGNFVTETNNSATPTATPPSGNEDYVPPTKGQEASYTTLKRGSSGTAVTNLVTELKLQGYYSGAITSVYTEAVEEAVKAFQKAKGLTVDGIAGSDTQHALFQTVPVGTGSNIDFTFYPAEKIDWFTGTINKDWAKGTNAKVYDVKTGIVWTARRWSGGNHAECEPLTAADTARLCKSYGVSKPSDIPWNYRPLLVLVGEHNYCASLYAVEHTSEGDGVINNNNFTGTLCIHFTNSKTHGTGVVVKGHQEDIEYAYQHAPGGQK